MKPVCQTIFGPPHGDCLRAAIASLFELELEDVPNFMEAEKWWEALNEFVDSLGYQHFAFDIDQAHEEGWAPSGYHLIHGLSPRGDYWHCIVGFKGEAVHDPYPGGDGLKEETQWSLFVDKLIPRKGVQ